MIAIYKMTSPKNKVYIGQTRNIITRKSFYKRGYSSSQPKVHRSIQKYGFDRHDFKVVYELPDETPQEIVNNYEIFFIEQLKEGGVEMLNIRAGGTRGKNSPETILKMSGRQASPALKAKNSLLGKGKTFEERYGIETAIRMKEAIVKSKTGKTWIDIMGVEKAAKRRSDLAIRRKNRPSDACKKINQYTLNGDFIKEWPSIKLAAEYFNKSIGAFWQCLNHRTASCSGYKWGYDKLVIRL